MTVILGSNRFVDCRALLAYKGQPILSLALDPLRVHFQTPSNSVAGRQMMVDETGVHPSDAGTTVITDRSFSVFTDEHAILIATLLGTDIVHLKLDLRPVGMNIYDDVAGLHIGGNVFSGNEIRSCAIAINLG